MDLALTDTKILQLINQYSINGSLTPSTSNADYLLKTRNLIDTCQKMIANEFPIIKSFEYIQVKGTDDFISHALPVDLEQILSVELKSYPNFQTIPYFKQGNNILTSPLFSGTIILNYTKIPDDITKDTVETTQLEVDKTYQEFIPYYVGGHIYLEDSPTIGATLINEFENFMNKARSKYVLSQNSVRNGWCW
jgi:hypothetical protein